MEFLIEGVLILFCVRKKERERELRILERERERESKVFFFLSDERSVVVVEANGNVFVGGNRKRKSGNRRL